jgi:NADH dehydrogenase (ubiquinone) 1 alpha subcomplex subunit 8
LLDSLLQETDLLVLTADTWLPTEEELTVQEVPLGTPSLRAGAFHLGKYCEVQNNEFMLCRDETNDPRACLKEGKDVTSCSLNFFKAVKKSCASEFTSYVTCMERSSSHYAFTPCRKTQAAFDACVLDNMGMERPHVGYHCLPKIHETDRPAPVETAPGWMNNDKAQKLKELPDDFPRDYRQREGWGSGSASFGATR